LDVTENIDTITITRHCGRVPLLLICNIAPALAWDRGHAEIFAVVPYLPGNVPVSIEGLTVGPDGTVCTPSFGFNSEGAVAGPPHLFSFRPNGALLHGRSRSGITRSQRSAPKLFR
jgi:hypothetical protein